MQKLNDISLAKICGRHNECHLEARFAGRCFVAGAVHAPAGGIGKSFPRILATLYRNPWIELVEVKPAALQTTRLASIRRFLGGKTW